MDHQLRSQGQKEAGTEWFKPQRFKHLFAPGNEALLAQFQKFVDDDWESLKKLQKISKS